MTTISLDDDPRGADPYWAGKRIRREKVSEAVRAELAGKGADVVATALHAGPGVVAAAEAVGIPTVLFVHSYESLCKYAYDAPTSCAPRSECRDCPRALALPDDERAELLASRHEHARSLLTATELIAPSRAVADEVEAWTGRRPDVAAGALRDVPSARADIAGPIVLAAARWGANKGSELLEPLADALAPCRLAITADGLDAELAERLRARPNVRVIPNAPVGELLDGAAALLVPSQWQEPFGRLAFEGLAAGVPTVASGVGGLREFVPAEQLVDPPSSPGRWRDAVEMILQPEHWEAARLRGRAAAAAVLATEPVRTIEAVLARAASTRDARAPVQGPSYSEATL